MPGVETGPYGVVEDLARNRVNLNKVITHKNLNLLGRYSFTASVPSAGALRPLRDPDAPELDEDDEVEGF